ncbi:MAG TPA: adenosylcobinamide-GDP ribazoletransferase [Pyrinomonadaceae bacterium]|nr:adenosylcobinamide-GDP ribazoletransferase [Pyrinomonadaceae bacterium]
MKSIVAAFKFLTILGRLSRFQPSAPMVGKAAAFFPVVGLVLGVSLALLARTLENYLDAEILSTTLVGFLIVATGGLHLEGLKKTFDAPELNQSRAGNESSSSAVATLAILFVILFKIKSIDILEEKLNLALLLAPVLARWAMLIFIYGSDRRSEGQASIIAANVKFWHVVLATVATLAPATYFLGRTALWIGLSLSILALLCRALFHKRTGVLTHDNYGAVVEASEALSLVLMATL